MAKLNTKRIRTLSRLAKPFGYKFNKVTNGGHLKFTGPGGVVFASASPSCPRTEFNFVRDIKRAIAK